MHGWDGYPEQGWFPWLKTELEKSGYAVVVPAMPHPEQPTIDDWVGALKAVVNKVDEQTYFVGHSMGCQTILRYIAGLPIGSKVAGVVLVAGFLLPLVNNEDAATEKPWIETALDTDKVKGIVRHIAAIFSPTDRWVPIENKKVFEQKLGAETFVLDGVGAMGHFAHGDGVTTLPKVLELIFAMSATPEITIDEFSKMEIRMGKILTAEKIIGADRLYKLSVDMGTEVRTICSGVAQFYQPEELVGKTVPVITNLAPRVLRGVESKGMILMADNNGPVLLTPIKEVPPGSIVK